MGHGSVGPASVSRRRSPLSSRVHVELNVMACCGRASPLAASSQRMRHWCCIAAAATVAASGTRDLSLHAFCAAPLRRARSPVRDCGGLTWQTIMAACRFTFRAPEELDAIDCNCSLCTKKGNTAHVVRPEQCLCGVVRGCLARHCVCVAPSPRCLGGLMLCCVGRVASGGATGCAGEVCGD